MKSSEERDRREKIRILYNILGIFMHKYIGIYIYFVNFSSIPSLTTFYRVCW